MVSRSSILVMVGFAIIICVLHCKIDTLIENLRELQHGYYRLPRFPGVCRRPGLLRP